MAAKQTPAMRINRTFRPLAGWLLAVILPAAFLSAGCSSAPVTAEPPALVVTEPGAQVTKVFPPTPTPAPATPAEDGFQAIQSSVAQAVRDPLLQKYVVCHLQAGLWGGYDMEVQVFPGMTSDGQGHTFRLKDGSFLDKKGPVNTSSVTVNWSGHVTVAGQEAAFSKGIPFFITQAAFEAPDTLKYTVISNPQSEIYGAFPLVESDEGGVHSTAADVPHTFGSSAQPVELTFHFNLPDDAPLSKGFLSIVTAVKGSNYCLVSNQVDLSALPR